jgi:hypothetical protein
MFLNLNFVSRTHSQPRATHPTTLQLTTSHHTQHTKSTIRPWNPSSDDHAIVHNSAHRLGMTSKPLSASSKLPYASTNALAVPVPLPFLRPEPRNITDTQIHNIHQLQMLSRSWRSHFTSDLHQTTSPGFRIIRWSISFILVDKRWVLFTHA